MKEIKNIFSSIICVVKTKPLYLVVKFFTIINSVIASLIPVFVIEEIGKTTEQTTPEGDILSIQVDLRLKEYTGKIPENKKQDKGFKKK